jgi:hypothetical protein
MFFLAKFMPHIITSVAVFTAIFTHYFLMKKFWQPCFIAALISTGVAYCLLLYLPIELPSETITQSALALKMSYFTFGSSLVLAILIGYVMKLMPGSFK